MGFDVEEYIKSKKQKNSTSSSEQKTQSFDVEAYVKSKDIDSVAENLTNRFNSWLESSSNYAWNYKNKTRGKSFDYTDSYVSDSADWLSEITKQKSALDAEREWLASTINSYSDFFDAEWRENALKALEEGSSANDSVFKAAEEYNKYWTSFDSEDAFNEWASYERERQKKLTADLDDLKVTVADLESKYEYSKKFEDELNQVELSLKYASHGGIDIGKAKQRKEELLSLINEAGSADVWFEKLSSKKAFYLEAEYMQGKESLESVTSKPDFEQYASVGESKKEREKWYKGIDNNVAYLRDPGNLAAYESSANGADGASLGLVENTLLDDLEYKAAKYMTDDEFKIYNYYIGKGDTKNAEAYLYSLTYDLNQRKAAGGREEIDGNLVLSTIAAISAGVDQGITGLKTLGEVVFEGGSEKYTPPTYSQMLSAGVREDVAEKSGVVGTTIFDLAQTTGNMLPSILTSTIVGAIPGLQGAAPVIGTAMMGGSAAGNAYTEMINLGYSDGQAKAYAAMTGASEALLSYALGGISKLGGKLSGKTITAIASGVDNAIGRIAIKMGGNMLSEFTEEGLQEVLTPFFENLATGTNINSLDDINWGDVAYSGLLGALSAGFLETGGTISSDIATTKSGKEFMKTGKDAGQNLANFAKNTFSADTVAYKIANKVNENTGAYTIGTLLQEANATLSEQNLAEIENGLIERGLAKSDAKKLARQYQAFLNGEMSFSDEQIKVLENTEPLSDILRKNIIGANTTVYQRTRDFNDVVNPTKESESKAGTAPYSKEFIDSLEYSAEQNGLSVGNRALRDLAREKFSVSESDNTTANKFVSEGKFKASEDGKTIVTETSEEVTPVKIVSTEGDLKVELKGGKVVEASKLSFSTDSEAIAYEMVAKMGVSVDTANALVNAFKTVDNGQMVMGDVPLAYQYGKIGYKEGLANVDLTDTQKQYVYDLGRADAEIETKAEQEKVTTNAKTRKGSGQVRFEKGAKAKSPAQKKAVNLATHLAKAIGIDIVFYDATIEGTYGSDSNGYFDERTNTIHLDLQNSNDDAKTIAFTMSHELVHFIKKWSPAKFKVFADFLMEQYMADSNTSNLLQKKMDALGTTDIDLAYEELIADACETMLLDSNAVVKLMELRKSDLDLFEKIKLHILQLLNKIRAEYKRLGLEPTSDEAKALLKMEDVLSKLHEMFEEAAVDATQNYQAAESLDTDAVSVTEDGTIRMQMKQYQQTGRATLLRYLVEQYGDKTASDLISTIDNIYNVLGEVKQNEALSVFSNWQDTEVELDENGHPIFTTSVNNGDYELNQDFSRVCKKRRQLDFVLNMLAEDPAFEASNLTKQDFVKINKAIKKHGFEIACALCFVDSKRFRQAEWADSFANTWNDILNAVVKDSSKLTPFNFATKNPNIADDGIEIDTSKSVMYRKWSDGKEDAKNRRTYESFDQMLSKDSDGKWLEGNTNIRTIATLIRDNPELRHTFRGADIIGSHGFDTIQRLAPKIRSILDGWGGSSVPKPSSNDASYDSSIINMSKYNKETAYAMGGVRMNSFSDFMAHMFFDYCQAFADLSAKELPSQAYTKELDYVRLFGRSGQKQNMSGIAAIRDNALPTTASKNVSKTEAATNEKIEKMIAGLDVSRLLEYLNKDIYQLTESDVEQFLDMCDYVWADESINMKHATLLQTGILYDKLSESKVEEVYELLKAGEVEQALKVAGDENVDREYAKHCGTIVVGVSDAHIRKLLRDPTIRMVIPYHKSGLNPVIARELRIAAYNDYTLAQTTGVKRKGTKTSEKIGSTAIKDAYGLKDFAFYDWFGKTIDGKLYDGKATADKYLEWCEKGYYDESVGDYVYYTTKGDGYILASEFHKKASIVPKFDTFASEENYYKLLEDFDCYDTITGEHSAQGAVDFLRNGLPSDYKDVLVRALKEEQRVSDDFRDHLDNKGLKDEVMKIVKERGYTPSAEKIANDDGIKKQVKRIVGNSGKDYGIGVYLDSTKLSGLTDEERESKVKKHIKSLGGKVFTAYDNDGTAVDIRIEKSHKKFTNSRGKKVLVYQHLTNYLKNPVKQEAVILVDELILTAKQESTEPARHPHDWLDNNGQNDWDVWTTYIQDKENTVWKAKLQIANSIYGDKILYEIYPIEKVEGVEEIDTNTSTDNRIPHSDNFVKRQLKKSSDKDYLETVNRGDNDIRFQKKMPTNRTLLANALEDTIDTSTQEGQNALKKLQEYKGIIGEIEKLEEERSEITGKAAELQRKKGKTSDEMKEMKDLWFKSNQIANRINTFDGTLLRIEAMKPIQKLLYREKELARKKEAQRGREVLAEYRESGQKRAIRTKIKNFKSKMEAMLHRPTDRQYVPMGLASAIIDVCELINTDTDLYKKDGSINKAQEKRELAKEKLRDLKDEYEKLKNHPDPMYSGEFDETVYAYLTDLQEFYGGRNLNEMTIGELQDMYEMLRAIDETLADARKLIGMGDAMDVYEAGDAIATEQAKITQKLKNGRRNAAQKARDKTLNFTLSPVRNVERMSDYNEDSFLLKLFKRFEKGIRKKNMFVMESYKLFESLTTGKNAKTYEDSMYTEYGGKKFTDVNGRKFGISKMQMMQTILSYEREKANHMNHIQSSGFSFADLDMLKKGKLKDAISEEYSHRVPSASAMVEGFIAELKNDKWAQDYMAVAREFFNGKAKDAVNEASLAMKHRIIAKDKNYIPFEVDKNFVVREISAQNDVQQTINSYGMLKETKAGASQPIIITGLNNILDRHIDQVGNVHGLAIEVRNFNKVWSVRSIDIQGNDPTVKAAIQRNWGVEGVKHIEQAVQDIQGSRATNQSALYSKIKSNYIGATFLLNLSVVTKQIGSLFTSTSMLRYRGPVRMLGNLFYTMANHKKISAEVDKYTATAWMRRQGVSDAELQTLMTEGKKSFLGKIASKAPTIINPTKWIAGMDSAVALSLWRYAKQDTAKRTGLKGEELLKATAEFYDEVVENTQSMTDVLHRPEVQKEGGIVSDALGMFKTDLYQMAGQLQVTAGRFMAKKSKENAKALGRTACSIVMSAVWAQLMTSLFALLRYKVNHYRDDEDEELTAESWLKRQSFSFVGDLFGYIFPLAGSEFVGIIENIMYGESEDVVDNLVLSAVNDFFDVAVGIASSVKDGEMPSTSDTQKLLTQALQLFGVPANNISRIVSAIRLHADDIANKEFMSFEAGVERNSSNHIHRIVEAMESGKTDVAKGLFEEAVEELALRKATEDGREVTEDDIDDAKSSLSTALGKKYKEGKVDRDTASEILSDFFEMSEYDIYWTFDRWDYTIENGSSDGYDKNDDLIKAIDSGDPKATVDEYVERKAKDNYEDAKAEAEKEGKTFNEKKALEEAEKKAKTSIKSVVTEHLKPLYKAAYKKGDTDEMKRIREILRDTELYGRPSEILETCKRWLKDSE